MGMPGKPAPEPKSSRVAIRSGSARAQAIDSTKWRVRMLVFASDCRQIDAFIPAKNKRNIMIQTFWIQKVEAGHTGRGQQPVEAHFDG